MDPTNLRITREQMSAAESILSGRSSATVLAAMSPQQPDALMRAVLVSARRRDVQLTLMFADLNGTFAFLDDEAGRDIREGRLRLVSLAGSIHRRWSSATDYLPYSLWDIDRMFAAGLRPVDVVLARVHANDQPGHAGYGDMIGYTASALKTNATAIFELVDPPSPTFYRSSESLPLKRAEFVLEAREDSKTASAAAPSSAELSRDLREIGRLAASLVPDDATLQLGMGSVAEAVAPNLVSKRALGVHTGLIAPSLNRLISSGAIAGSAKAKDVGLAVATGLFSATGTRGDDWGARTELRPISDTHSPRVLSDHHRLWAVNSALEIDLAGQVNVEFVDGTRIASGGGQTDFARAAHACDGGASVIALQSRTRHGRSRLVPRLPSNSLPTLNGQDVDFVVTENGVAQLRGLSASEKATALIAVAHPDDRDRLRSVSADSEFAAGGTGRPMKQATY